MHEREVSGPSSATFGSLLSHWEGHLAQGALFVDIGLKSTQNGRYENSIQHRHSGLYGEGETFVQEALLNQRDKPVVLLPIQ